MLESTKNVLIFFQRYCQGLNFQDQDQVFIWNTKTRPRPRLIVDQVRNLDLAVQDQDFIDDYNTITR